MSAKFFGFNYPYLRGQSLLGTSSKILPRQEDHRLIINDLIILLMTIPGERWFRPSFGAGIPTFLFDPNDSTSFTNIRNAITEAVQRYEPRIILSNVDVVEGSNPNIVNIRLFGRTSLDSTNKDKLLTQFIIPVAGAP